MHEKLELDEHFVATYDELRRLAARVRGNDRGPTLNPTALVNEAYIKLASSPGLIPESPLHFRRLAARAMRQVLVEAARRRRSLKRGADYAIVTFDDDAVIRDAGASDVIELDQALERLSRMNTRQALLVEYRFFGGAEVAEAAAMLGISESTALRDWRIARAWLESQLRPIA